MSGNEGPIKILRIVEPEIFEKKKRRKLKNKNVTGAFRKPNCVPEASQKQKSLRRYLSGKVLSNGAYVRFANPLNETVFCQNVLCSRAAGGKRHLTCLAERTGKEKSRHLTKESVK